MAPRTPKNPESKPAKAKSASSPATPSPAASGAKPARKAAPASNPAVPSTGLKLKDLVDQVAAATGTRKAEVKASVEATLAALAAALKTGADMTLPPLGKLRVVKLSEKGGATVMTLKLRHGSASTPAAKPLADDGEDG